MEALFIGQTYIDVTFITDHMPSGDEKYVASAYAVSFGGKRRHRRLLLRETWNRARFADDRRR